MDILKFIEDTKQVVKFESDTGARFREILICPICRSKYNNRKDLYEHLGTGHVNQSYTTCHICQKQCRGPGALRAHMALHATTGIFICTILGCNVRSSSIGQVCAHIREAHFI